jgi:long-chain acyl-CoA synthetase
LLSLPLFHIGGLQQVITPLVGGGTVVFHEGRFDAATVVDLIERERVKVWSAVPTMVSRVIDYLSSSGRPPIEILTTVGLGGSPVVEHLRTSVTEWFPNVTRGLAVTYGLSEACGVVATGAGPDVLRRPGTVGKPLDIVAIRIDEPDETGAGEVLIRCPGVMLGYWRAASDNGVSFDHGPISDDRWLRTGDVGTLDDEGYLYITDRSKDIVIRGGENIASPHVESCLLAHPDVREVAVFGLPEDTLGEEVAAAVVLHSGATVTAEALADFVSSQLAYFEVPTKWKFHAVPLPQNATGKILKRQLRQEWIDELTRVAEAR